MSCPTCHSPKWVEAPARASSLFGRFLALFSTAKHAGNRRKCTFCGCIYRESDDVDEDVIAGRMSRIQEQMSSFDWTSLPPPGQATQGLQLTESYLCLGCGANYPDTDRECQQCGWRPDAWRNHASPTSPKQSGE